MSRFYAVIMSVFLLLPVVVRAQEITDAQKAAEAAAKAIADAPKAQEKVKKPRYWTNSLLTKLDFTQTNLTNWSKGGYNSVTLKSFIDINANYKKNDLFFNNRLQLDYGFLYSEDKPFIQKSDDRIYYEGKFGHKAGKSLNYSAQFSLRSQFSNSYNYFMPGKPDGAPDDWEPGKSDWMGSRQKKSGLLSPAHTSIALGIDWVPTKWMTINMAPLTGGFVIVTDENLRRNNGMQRRKDYEDMTQYPDAEGTGYYYRPTKFELGAQVKIDWKLRVNNNFSYTSQLLLFSNYLDHPLNMRVNWDNRIDWKLAKYFSLTLTTNLVYDDKVLIVSEKWPQGKKAIQFKESLAFGFSYTIASRK